MSDEANLMISATLQANLLSHKLEWSREILKNLIEIEYLSDKVSENKS